MIASPLLDMNAAVRHAQDFDEPERNKAERDHRQQPGPQTRVPDRAEPATERVGAPGTALDRRDDEDRSAGAEHDPAAGQTKTSERQNGRPRDPMERSKIEPSIYVADAGAVEHLKADEDRHRSRDDQAELTEWMRHHGGGGELSSMLGRALREIEGELHGADGEAEMHTPADRPSRAVRDASDT